MKSNVDLYLDAVDKELICGKKRRKALMKQLAADIEGFSDERGGTLTMEDLELHFGTSGEMAESLLKQADVPEIKKLVNKKKMIIACVAVTCVAIIVCVVCYFGFDNARKEKFVNGHESETIVFSEQELPEHIENIPENAEVN